MYWLASLVSLIWVGEKKLKKKKKNRKAFLFSLLISPTFPSLSGCCSLLYIASSSFLIYPFPFHTFHLISSLSLSFSLSLYIIIRSHGFHALSRDLKLPNQSHLHKFQFSRLAIKLFWNFLHYYSHFRIFSPFIFSLYLSCPGPGSIIPPVSVLSDDDEVASVSRCAPEWWNRDAVAAAKNPGSFSVDGYRTKAPPI